MSILKVDLISGFTTDLVTINSRVSEGYQTTALGVASHAEGYYSLATGEGSHAEGGYDAGGYIAAGGNSVGKGSHAEGTITLANGIVSHAEGSNTTADGLASHAEGANSTASDDFSHAEGYQTTALGVASHAEGYYSFASGDGSHAEGGYDAGGYVAAGGNAIGKGSHADTVYVPNFVIKKSSAVPTSSSDSVGENGSITWDNTYFYWKANGQWLRIAGSTF